MLVSCEYIKVYEGRKLQRSSVVNCKDKNKTHFLSKTCTWIDEGIKSSGER
jgi:hypothetical protein